MPVDLSQRPSAKKAAGVDLSQRPSKQMPVDLSDENTDNPQDRVFRKQTWGEFFRGEDPNKGIPKPKLWSDFNPLERQIIGKNAPGAPVEHGHTSKAHKLFSSEPLERGLKWAEERGAKRAEELKASPLLSGMAKVGGALPRFAVDTLSDPTTVGTGLAGLLRPKPRIIPEVEPPPSPPPVREQKLLPPGRDPFIAGPGGVQRQSLLNPQEEARLAGYEVGVEGPLGKPSVTPGPKFTDLDEVREAERLKGVYFTGHEQAGGTSLNVPNKPLISAPPIAGDTRLGFRGVSQADDLQYPVNIAPESVRPRSTQEVTRSLTGDRFAQPVVTLPKTEFGNELPVTLGKPNPIVKDPTRAIEPGEAILPSAKPRPLRKANKVGTTPEQEVVDLAKASGNDEVAEAATKITLGEKGRANTIIGRIYTQLDKLSGKTGRFSEGSELTRKSQKYVHDTRQKVAAWAPEYKTAISNLRKVNSDEADNFLDLVEGNRLPTTPEAKKALEVWAKVQNAIGDDATKEGLRLYQSKKKWIPFQKHPGNYFPHISKETIDPKAFLNKLVNDGVPLREAQQIVRRFRNEGEIVIGSQRARRSLKDLGFRKDAEVGLAHIHSMAKRISQHMNFGPEDLTGKGSAGINDLIMSTKDPQLAEELMSRIIGRNERGNKILTDRLNLARKIMSYMHLKNFSVPNIILGQQSTLQKTPIRIYAQELGKVLTNPKYRNQIKASGVIEDFNMSLADEMGHMKDIYLIRKGEVANRMVAGAAGRGTANHFFKILKKDPTNKVARAELADLIPLKVDDLLKQPALTEQQLNYASGRMAEMTQALNVPGNLPYYASQPVRGTISLANQLYWIYKKTGYQAAKGVFDSIKRNPVKNLPKWIALTGIAGTLVRGTKVGINSLWSGNFKNEWETSDDWVERVFGKSQVEGVAKAAGVRPETVTRIIDIQSQAFMFGLFADALTNSASSPEGLAKFLAGPAGQEAGEWVNIAVRGDVEKAKRKVVKGATPLPGNTKQSEILVPKEGKSGPFDIGLGGMDINVDLD